MITQPQLQYPEVHDFENPTFERREAVVRRWAGDLPVLNLVKTVPELTEQLPLLVHEPLSPTDKLRLLELFRVPINSVMMAAENRRLRQTPISSSARQRIQDGVLALCYNLAAGYKVVMHDLLERGRDPATDKQLQTCIQRVLEQLRNALMHSFRIYRAVPPKHYLEMHQLHLYADRCGLATKPLPDAVTPPEDQTPQKVYLRAMLLAIADPFRLVDGAIEELYRFLSGNIELCRLTAGLGGDAKTDGLFLLRSDSDLPPTLFGRAQLDRAGEVPYTLDATALMRLLSQPMSSSGESLEGYAKWLLPRFKVAWDRASARKHVHKKARLAGGLEAACYLLSPVGHETLTKGANDALGIEVHELEDEEATTYALETWDIVNESVNGFMLKHPGQAGEDIRVGDLVLAVPEADKTPQPLIAVVRWFGVKEHSMRCGIEILPGHPTAVSMETVLPNPELLSGRGIYLPAVKSIQAPPTLVAPKGLHKPLHNLRVEIGNKKQTVSCGEVLTATEYIDRFRFGRA